MRGRRHHQALSVDDALNARGGDRQLLSRKRVRTSYFLGSTSTDQDGLRAYRERSAKRIFPSSSARETTRSRVRREPFESFFFVCISAGTLCEHERKREGDSVGVFPRVRVDARAARLSRTVVCISAASSRAGRAHASRRKTQIFGSATAERSRLLACGGGRGMATNPVCHWKAG